MLRQLSGPIPVVELFADLHARLLSLLRGLDDSQWELPTVCSQWCVKDIAAHLLDGDLRRLSVQRDDYTPPGPPTAFESSADLTRYLHELNGTWTRAARRMSPRVLIDLLEVGHPQVIELFRSLDPHGRAPYGVAWAGEEMSANWFDIAREYTERWHHQAQIRLAVNQMEDLQTARFYRPVLETFLLALPYTFRDSAPTDGTVIGVAIEGEAGGEWSLVRQDATWTLFEGRQPEAAARTVLPAEVAWQVFTKRLDSATARARFPAISLEGDFELAGRVLELVSIMA